MRGMVTWLIGCPAGILCVAGIIIIGSTMLMRIQRKRVAIVPGPEPTGPTPPPVPAEPAPLPRAEQLPACPSCGAALRSASRFCGSCGAEIQHEPPVSQARLSVKPAEISPLTCSFCGKAVKPSSRFCGFCGAPVVVAGGGAGSLQPVSTTPSAPVCPVCMSRITPGAKFCGSCGSPLLAQGPSPPALPDRKSGQ
jgi:predicted amidophosphoribosyltransferase